MRREPRDAVRPWLALARLAPLALPALVAGCSTPPPAAALPEARHRRPALDGHGLSAGCRRGAVEHPLSHGASSASTAAATIRVTMSRSSSTSTSRRRPARPTGRARCRSATSWRWPTPRARSSTSRPSASTSPRPRAPGRSSCATSSPRRSTAPRSTTGPSYRVYLGLDLPEAEAMKRLDGTP